MFVQHKIFVVSKKELEKLKEAGFVPGIYNFCDRWCEKCAQQSKCMSYVVGKKMEKKLGMTLRESLHANQESTWTYLKNIFDTTYEILHELAEERGIDMEDIYAAEDMEKGFWSEEVDEELKDAECDRLGEQVVQIVQVCIIYTNLCEECLDKVFALLDEKEWTLGSPEGKETEEALDRINWYVDVISNKVKTALLALYHSLDPEMRDICYEDGYNGSAKVALLAIRISTEAWETLKKYCTLQVVKDIVHVQVVLEQLQRDIEARFPGAHAFRRPGFDD